MNDYTLKLEAPWERVKEQLKEVNVELTDEDLVFTPGKEKELLDRVSARIKKSVPDTKAWIESVSHNDGIAS